MTAELRKSDFSVGWICAIPIELAAVEAILDETYPQLDAADGDTNLYKFGRIGRHNVVISWLPAGTYGVAKAGIVAAHMRSTFSRLRFGLMVGVGGGAPSKDNDIRLGDIVISQPTGVSGGVIQYDFGKAMENGEFLRIGSLSAPPPILLKAVTSMKAGDQAKLGQKISDSAQKIEEEEEVPRFPYPGQDTDKLFRADYNHVAGEGRQSDTCKSCNASKVVPRSEREYDYPYIHYGIIASGNQVMKDGLKRDRISAQTGALCFEMEAAGLMDDFPCLVIRGICDYSDGHKNKRWQPYAALVAATYAKELLLQIPAVSKDGTDDADTRPEKIKEINFVVPFRMPSPRNRNFTRTISIFRIFALTGTGGMGKTEIALEYAYRHYRNYTAVFWISAASENTIRTSFVDIVQRIVKEQARTTWPESPPDYQAIGSKLGISGLIDEKGTVSANLEAFSNIRSALLGWLQLPGNNRWLLIFDNADDLETFCLKEYFPNQGSGAIFITSRRPEFSQSAKQVDLEGLDSKSAIALLLNLAHLTDSEVPENDAITLVEKLGFMPLAISHAGCYIYETKLPLGDYLHYYNDAFMAVQSRKPRFGWNYRNDTAATTWEISFLRVEEQDKEAAALLLVCSCLNPEEIFDNLWGDGLVDKVEIQRKVILLASYSLVKITKFGVFSVHPVVHLWARERSDRSERFKAIRSAVTILGKASRRVNLSRNTKKWEHWEETRVASHLEYLHQYLKPLFSAFFLDGHSGTETTFFQEERKSENQIYFDVNSIALVFSNQGKYSEAMQWYERALAGKEKALGKDHPSTLDTVHNIAGVFSKQGKYDKAMQWYERAFAGCEKALGKDHQSTLDTVNNIAGVFSRQGKYDEAMQWYERALAGYEKALGKDHSLTLNTVNNIALVFFKQGKYDEAMQWYERALAGKENALGKDHPSTLSIVHNIAGVFSRQGKYDEAMQWYERALAGSEKALGKDHQSTLDTVNNIAEVFDNQGKYDEAMQWYERALAGYEKALSKDHPSTLNTVHNIAGVFSKQGKYDKAMQWYERALAGKEKVLGKDHPSTLDTVNNIAGVFDGQGKYDEAMQWYERALAGSEKALGKDHPSTLDTVHNIALVFSKQGKYDEAMQWYERAFIGYEKALGKDHPSTLNTVNNIAGVFFKQGKYDEAMQWYERALAGKEKALGKDHPSTLDTVNNIALVFDGQGKYDEAMQWYERALAGSEKALGKDHPSTLDTVHNIALVFSKQGKYDKAMQWYKRALVGCEKALGKDHPSTLLTAQCLVTLTENMTLLK